MEEIDKLRSFYSKAPVNRHFGFQLISRSADGVTVSMEVLPDYLQEEGVVQGGVISAIADNAAVHSFISDIDKEHLMTSIEFKMNFLRPALAGQEPLIARSKVIRRGRNVGVSEVEVTQSGRLVAKGSFTYLFIDRD